MKHILIAFILLSSVVSRGEVLCQKEAETLVAALENALANVQGAVQGDLPEYQFTTTLQKQVGDKAIIVVDSAHTNEDQEPWTQQYTLTYTVYGKACYIYNYSFGYVVE
ncbi:MAG: hypothetical protein H6623_06300 [Bdellovibrionaceae bacterium]|nr:hypothetical protein [Pseudobdellovibrionaceae bacterium]